MHHRYIGLFCGAAASLGLSAALALDAAPAAEEETLEEVIVTGTLVRGVAPTGSQVATVSIDDIESSGATQTNQILSSIPQMANAFNIVPNVPTAAQGRTTFRPQLRGLPPLGNNTTLVLVDGHNIVGAAIQQNSPDIGSLPIGAIERVELVLDGGSATYGSDAVAGTLNFITRNRFKGVELSADAGGAGSNYRNYAFNVTAGHEWGGGGLVLAASTRSQSEMPAGDLDLPRQDLRSYGFTDFRVLNCVPGTVAAGTGATAVNYALPNLQVGSNLCDQSLDGVITPEERQTGLFAAVSHSLTDTLEFKVKAFGSQRTTTTRASQLALANGRATIRNTNPYFIPLNNSAGAAQATETVNTTWASVLGPYASSEVKLKMYDVSPSLTWQLARGWQATFLGDYGWSKTEQDTPGINTVAETAALNATTAATALNPYNLPASNAAVLQNIINWGTHAYNEQKSMTLRAIVDGPVGQLPGGEAKAAIGAQFQRLSKNGFSNTGPLGSTAQAVTDSISRNISALFAELVLPIVGDGNAKPGIQSLDLNLSGRYDHYEGVGNTTNPKIGFSWGVVDGVKFRGNWGTSFVAPSLQDSIRGGIDAQVQIAATTAAIRAGDAVAFRNSPNVVLTGGNGPGLTPVTTTSWSFGFDLTPPQLQGFTASATYWSYDMDDVITSGCAGNFQDQINNTALDGICYYYRPTQALAQSLTSGFQIFTGGSVAALYAANNPPYYIQSRERKNLGGFRTNGVDFNVGYSREFGWGMGSVNVAGTRYLMREQSQIPNGPFSDVLATNYPPTTMQLTLKAEHGSLLASATANYLSGFDITGAAPQTSLPAFTPVNLFVRYRFENQLSLTLNVNNVADTMPPVANVSGGIFLVNGLPLQSTLGRTFSIGLSKHFE